MCRPPRILLNAAAVASLALCAATLVLWARSYWICETLTLADRDIGDDWLRVSSCETHWCTGLLLIHLHRSRALAADLNRANPQVFPFWQSALRDPARRRQFHQPAARRPTTRTPPSPPRWASDGASTNSPSPGAAGSSGSSSPSGPSPAPSPCHPWPKRSPAAASGRATVAPIACAPPAGTTSGPRPTAARSAEPHRREHTRPCSAKMLFLPPMGHR